MGARQRDGWLLAVAVAAFAAGAWAASLMIGCSETWTGPVTPITPVDPITPPAPPVVPPTPVDPSRIVPYATVATIAPGQAKTAVYAAMALPPTLESAQDDGATTARWPAVNAAGEARWVVVTFDRAGLVIGHVLVPRAP